MLANILIGTPAISKEVTTEYLVSIFRLQKHFARRSDISLDIYSNSLSQIEKARNLIASMVLARKEITHLLFVDADMGFAPDLIDDMLAFDKPIVGAISPARHLGLSDVRGAPEDATDNELHWVTNKYVSPALLPDDQGRIVVRNGKFVRVEAVGTGIMLIQRSVFERMAELPNLFVEPFFQERPEYPPFLLNCFAQIPDKNGVHVSEDISFCKRWSDQCGGEIWASVAHEVLHVGSFTHRGLFLSKMRAKWGVPDSVLRSDK